MTMIEAMSCGTPVIAFARGAVKEVIVDGRTGFICPANNVEAMVGAVKKINQIDRMICRNHVEKNFTIQRMVDNFEKIYKKIVIKK